MNGKYVIKMGEFYICKALEDPNSVDIFLERDLRDAKMTSLEQAKIITDKIGGKILKINLELEEV